MATHASLLFALSALGLLAGLAGLVLAKRVLRSLAERRSRARRARWLAALGGGPVADMRMAELRALAREASRRLAAQEDLLALLHDGRLPPGDARREPFLRALRRGGLARALRKACDSSRPVARGRAALLWARLGLEGAEHRAAPLLTDPDADVRAVATQVLACCASEEAAWALLQALREGAVEPERAVERLGGAWAAPALLAALELPEFRPVLPWLAEGLGLTGDPRAEGPLVALLAGGREEERIRASRALGRIARPGSGPALVAALADASASVRAQSARALGVIGDERAVDALAAVMGDESWWVRARAAEALRALGEPGLRALRRCALDHPDPFARERAAHALALAPASPAPALPVLAAA